MCKEESSAMEFKTWLHGYIQDLGTRRMLWERIKKNALIKDYRGRVVDLLAQR